MWNAKIKGLENGKIQKFSLQEKQKALRFSDAFKLLRDNPSFQFFFNKVLADAPFPAYFWECPPVTKDTWNQTFEFVLVNAPTLANASPDNRAFSGYWNSADSPVVVFTNIGKDALLVAPCPLQKDLSPYAHLAAFCRTASESQRTMFWQQVGTSTLNELHQEPLWVSTSGLGVYWLHVRLDSRPKYYTYAPYRYVNDPSQFNK